MLVGRRFGTWRRTLPLITMLLAICLFRSSDGFRKCEHLRKLHRNLVGNTGNVSDYLVAAGYKLTIHASCALNDHDSLEVLSGFAVAVFTVFLWLSTYRLWEETKRLAIGAEQQSQDMQASIKQATRSAAAMEDMAFRATQQVSELSTQASYMADTMFATGELSKAAQLQAEVVERTFMGLERPLLLVSTIRGEKSAPGLVSHGNGSIAVSGKPIKFQVWITVRNYGRSPAIVEEIMVVAVRTERLPDLLIHRVPNSVLHDMVIEARSEAGPFSSNPIEIPFGYIESEGPDALYGYGFFKYRDVYGYVFLRKFCFRFISPQRAQTIHEHTGEKRFEPERSLEFPDPPPLQPNT